MTEKNEPTENQTVLDEAIYEQLANNAEAEKPEESPYSEEDQKKMQAELQKYYYGFKKRFKVKPKSELVAIIWEQGMQYKKLQDIAQQLYEENRALKGESNVQKSNNVPTE